MISPTNRFKKIIAISSFCLILPAAQALYAQEADEAPVDSTFEEKISDMWQELRNVRESEEREKHERLQRDYMEELFEYYLEYKNTPTGIRAAESGFLMAGNLGEALRAKEIMEHIDSDSELWSRIIMSVGNAYIRSDEKEQEDHVNLLWQLEGELTHPRSRSAVILTLAEHFQRSENEEDKEEVAREFFREVVELDADSIMVDMALGNLYEMDALGIGQEAPDFEATTLEGEAVSLSDLRGNVVLLEFWAVWCGPCHPEIPYLKEVWEKYQDDNFMLLGISLDRDADELNQFIEEEGMTWPQIFEGEVWDAELAEKYNVRGIPRAYLIDSDGRIAARDFRREQKVEEVRKLMDDQEQ